MQLNGKHGEARLADLRRGQTARIAGFHLPDGIVRRLMELGFLPGASVCASHSAPGGDPKVFDVDGCSVALRRELAEHVEIELVNV